MDKFKSINLSFSFGVFSVDSGTKTGVKDLLKEVDMKMYQHKKSKTL
jgi:PleD family two-component response regulator